jgi:hypothetical protein
LNTMMGCFVLSDRRLASIAEWQQAISAEGFGLVLSTQTPFDALDGFLPAELCERRTGFECAHWDLQVLVGKHPELHFDHRWSYVLAFRWDACDMFQTPAAAIASAAYASATGGMLFADRGSGRPISPERAVRSARNLEKTAHVMRNMPEVEAAIRLAVEQMNTEQSNMPQKNSEKLPPAGSDYKIVVRRIN